MNRRDVDSELNGVIRILLPSETEIKRMAKSPIILSYKNRNLARRRITY